MEQRGRGRPEPARHVLRQHRHARCALLAPLAFIEQERPLGTQDAGLHGLPTGPSVTGTAAGTAAEALRGADRVGGDLGTAPVSLGFPAAALPGQGPGEHHHTEFRWLMASDVCKPSSSSVRANFGLPHTQACEAGPIAARRAVRASSRPVAWYHWVITMIARTRSMMVPP